MTDLSDRMRALVKDHPDKQVELERLAKEFDDKSSLWLAHPDNEQVMRSMMGAWVRARRYYCELTGQSLV